MMNELPLSPEGLRAALLAEIGRRKALEDLVIKLTARVAKLEQTPRGREVYPEQWR